MEWSPGEIKALRKRYRITRHELGSLVGATTDYIASVEKGLKKPCLSLRILLDYLENQLKIFSDGKSD